MELNEGLLKYVKYGLSMRTGTSNDIPYYIVSLTYPAKWIVCEPGDKDVSCLPNSNESQKGMYFYFTPIEHGIGPIFETIEETVSFNEELELKGELLRKKATELNEIFTKEPYERLLTLQFVFDDKTDKQNSETKPEVKKRGRKPGKKNKIKKGSEEKVVETMPGPVNNYEEPIEPPMEENIPEVAKNEPGTNMEEASEIDKKIAMAMGKF